MTFDRWSREELTASSSAKLAVEQSDKEDWRGGAPAGGGSRVGGASSAGEGASSGGASSASAIAKLAMGTREDMERGVGGGTTDSLEGETGETTRGGGGAMTSSHYAHEIGRAHLRTPVT